MKHRKAFDLFLLLVVTLLFAACRNEKNQTNESYLTITENRETVASNENAQVKAVWPSGTLAKKMNDKELNNLLVEVAKTSSLINFHYGATTAFSLLGRRYGHRERYDSSLFYFKKALHHSLNLLPNDGTSAKLYIGIGKVYSLISKDDSACVYMYRGLSNLQLGNVNSKEEKVLRNAHTVYRELGAFWMRHDNLDNALLYLNKTSILASLSKVPKLVDDALLVKGTVFFRKNNIDSAIKYYNALLKKPYLDVDIRILANENMARIYLKMPDKPSKVKSLPHLLEAYRLNKRYQYKVSMRRTEYLLAALYYSLEEFRKSEKLLENIVNDTSNVTLGLSDLVNQHKNLASIYETSGKFKKGYQQMVKVVALQDTLIKQERTRSINEFEFKYRTVEKDKLLAQKELQVSKQQKELERQYTLLIGGGSGALLIIIALGLLLRVKKQKLEIQRLKATMIGEERERARMARELHDGTVSTLSAIRMNLSALPLQHPEMNGASQDLQKSLLRLDQTIAELRNTSHNLLPEFLYKAGLTEAVRVYTSDISSLGQVEIEFMMIGQMPALKQDFQLTVYRIIQELINNIIKHANASHVLVQFQVMNEQLNITVDDNGTGIPFEQSKSSNGIGLQNLRNRVKSLNGTLEIESNKGTSVYLTFNLQPFTINTVAGKMQGQEQ